MLHADFSFVHVCLKVRQRSDSVLSTSSTKIYNGTNMFKHYVIRARLMYRDRNGKYFLCLSSPANTEHSTRSN